MKALTGPKWNNRFFFAFSKRTQLWLPVDIESSISTGYLRFEGNGKIPLGRWGKKFALLAVSV